MAPLASLTVRSLTKRASLKPLTPASLALIIVGSLLVVSMTAVGIIYYRKRRSRAAAIAEQPKAVDRSSSTASEEHQLQNIASGAPNSNTNTNGIVRTNDDSQNHRYSVGIMSRVSYGGSARSPRMPRSPAANNRYSVGMLSRTSIDPAVSSPNPDRDRSRSRSRAEKGRAYSRMSMGVMSRSSMAPRSPGPRSPRSRQDPLLSAGIMSRMSMGPVSPLPRNLSAAPSPALREQNEFLEPPPRYS